MSGLYLEQKKNIRFALEVQFKPNRARSVQQKETSFASSSCDVSRHGSADFADSCIESRSRVQVLEWLREQIRCLERRAPTLEPVIQDAQPSGRSDLRSTAFDAGKGNDAKRTCPDGAPDTLEDVSFQAGLPADRFVAQDGCMVSPTPKPAMQPSSLPLSDPYTGRSSKAVRSPKPRWTLQPFAPSSAGAGVLSTFGPSSHFSPGAIELETGGLHEIKPAFEATEDEGPGGIVRGDWAAATNGAFGFFTALIARRIAGYVEAAKASGAMAVASGASGLAGGERMRILWCFSRAARAEYGLPYIHGLEAIGLKWDEVVIAETANEAETLWALEEGIRSGAPALVAGVVDDIPLTPARRLALAAEARGVPCLVLTDARAPPAAATATRWRVGAAASGCSELEMTRRNGEPLRLPGPRRFAVALERCRREPGMVGSLMHLLEWRHEAVCFDLVAAVPHRPAAAGAAGGSAPGQAVRAR
jgi:protein ImuA